MRPIAAVLAAGLFATAACADETAGVPGPEAMLGNLSQAARRGDQAGVDALLDKPRVTLARQAQRDELTGHGRWLKAPDATCAEWRPVSRRWLVDPQTPLSAAELAAWLRHGPGEPTFYPQDGGSVRVDIPFGVTAAALELEARDGQWVVVGAFDHVEAPLGPQFECARSR